MAFIYPKGLQAQGFSDLLEVSFKDTLYSSESSTLSNTFVLKNLSADTLYLSVLTDGSREWKALNTTAAPVVIAPRSKSYFPVNLIRQHVQINGLWSMAGIRVVHAGTDTATYRFAVKNKLITKFSLEKSGEKELYFQKNETQKNISFTLRNDGNALMHYDIALELNKCSIRDQYHLNLYPHKDTVLNYNLKINQEQVKDLQNDVLQVLIKDDSNNKAFINYMLSYCTHKAVEHANRYDGFPLTIETGVLSRSNSNYMYASVAGMANLGKNRILQYNYKTEEYTQQNQLQRDVFNISYTSRRWTAHIGQAQHQMDFYSYGNEAYLGIKFGKSGFNKGGGFAVWAVEPYRNAYNSSEQLGACLNYHIKGAGIAHTFIAAYDSAHQMQAVIFNNKFRIINKKYIRLEGNLGVGIDSVKPGNMLQRITANPGTSYGLSFQANYKKFGISLSSAQNSINYPGLYRGQSHLDYSLTWHVSKRVSLTPFYNSNKVTNNFNIDTVLYTNLIQFNMERYGLRGSVTSGRLSLSGGLGYYKNTASLSMPVYHYGDLGMSYQSGKFMLMLNSQNGLTRDDVTGKQDIWFSSTNISASTKHLQLTGNYYHYPVFNTGDAGNSYIETMNLITSYRFSLFNRLSGDINYDIARYAMNSIITHNAGGSLTYQGRDNGLNIKLEGSIPLQKTNEDNAQYLYCRNYIQCSFSKRFNVPAFNKKRYFDLKVRLYKDANNNNIKDKEEEFIEQAYITINGRLFITGTDGCVRYEHLNPGSYSLDYTKVKAGNGLIPAHGYSESVDLNQDVTIDVPFKTGKIITGNIRFLADTLSETRFSPEGLKIIVSDSTSVVAYALANDAGNFTVTVPAGLYKVALNPDAFNEKVKPVQLSYNIDLTDQATATVNFEVKQKRREIRLLQTNPDIIQAPPVRKAEKKTSGAQRGRGHQ